jgi:PAT family beta-lactamase induction signal transducer AmpG
MPIPNGERSKRLLTCVALGFASGMPLYLLIQLVPAWLREADVSLTDIGLLSLVSLPYTWKFLWAPFMDRWAPLLGLRRGWMLLTQLALIGLIGALMPLIESLRRQV